MRTILVLSLLAAPLWAGAIRVEVSDTATNPEARQKQAVLVARITACLGLDKTVLTATAEGVVDGKHRSIPLKLIPLSEAGSFAIKREWPQQGAWTVKLLGSYPEHKGYVMGMLVPFDKETAQLNAVRRFTHAPNDTEVMASLN
jgi:hypothetical protein